MKIFLIPLLVLKNIVLNLCKFILNALLTIACIPLLFFCATGLMMAMSSTIPWSFLETSVATLWSLFGIMGILAFFITWFKRPGKVLVTFTICGIIAALPIVVLGIVFALKGAASFEAMGLDWSALKQIDFAKLAEKDELFIQRLVVSNVILLAVILAPTLFVLKALYVLYCAYREKSVS